MCLKGIGSGGIGQADVGGFRLGREVQGEEKNVVWTNAFPIDLNSLPCY